MRRSRPLGVRPQALGASARQLRRAVHATRPELCAVSCPATSAAVDRPRALLHERPHAAVPSQTDATAARSRTAQRRSPPATCLSFSRRNRAGHARLLARFRRFGRLWDLDASPLALLACSYVGMLVYIARLEAMAAERQRKVVPFMRPRFALSHSRQGERLAVVGGEGLAVDVTPCCSARVRTRSARALVNVSHSRTGATHLSSERGSPVRGGGARLWSRNRRSCRAE